MTEEINNDQNAGRKWGTGALGGCGVALGVFVLVTICSAVAFPFLVTMNGGSYAESQYFLNFVIPPICGAVAALIAGVAGFIFFFQRGSRK